MLKEQSIVKIIKVVEHFLDIFQETTITSVAYQEAVKRVVNEYGSCYQAIGDLCRRRLGFTTIDEFWRLLEEFKNGDTELLINILKKNTKEKNYKLIDDSLKQIEKNSKYTSITVYLNKAIQKKLHHLAIEDEIDPTDLLGQLLQQNINNLFDIWCTKL